MNPARFEIAGDDHADTMNVVCLDCGGIIADDNVFTLAEIERFAGNHHCVRPVTVSPNEAPYANGHVWPCALYYTNAPASMPCTCPQRPKMSAEADRGPAY